MFTCQIFVFVCHKPHIIIKIHSCMYWIGEGGKRSGRFYPHPIHHSANHPTQGIQHPTFHSPTRGEAEKHPGTHLGGGYLLKSPAAPVREGSIPSQALPAPPAGVAPPEPRPPVFIPPLRLPKPPDPPLELADLWRSLEDLSYTSSSIEDWWPPLLAFGFKNKTKNGFF